VFASDNNKREKQWIASTLLRLGDSSPVYSDFLIDSAKDAIQDRTPLAFDYDQNGETIKGRFSDRFEACCKANGKDPRSVAALQFGTYPEDVLLLARAQDSKANASLRRALESANPLVVAYAVQGLGRLGDPSAIPLIAKVSEAFPVSARAVIAMNLPWFSSSDAFRLMEHLAPDPNARQYIVRLVQQTQEAEQENALRRLGGQPKK
jgi:hypothetical protein